MFGSCFDSSSDSQQKKKKKKKKKKKIPTLVYVLKISSNLPILKPTKAGTQCPPTTSTLLTYYLGNFDTNYIIFRNVENFPQKIYF